VLVLVAAGEAESAFPAKDSDAASEIIRSLEESGVLLPDESLIEGEGI